MNVIDSIISAELPRGNSKNSRELRKLVKRFNMRGLSSYCRSKYFGGIVIVLSGDYAQLLLVATAVSVNNDSSGHADLVPARPLKELSSYDKSVGQKMRRFHDY